MPREKTPTRTPKTQTRVQPDAAEMARRQQLVDEDKAALKFSRLMGLLPPHVDEVEKEFNAKYSAGTTTDEDYAKYELAMRIANDAVLRHSTIMEKGYIPESRVSDKRVSEWRAKLPTPNL